jgi:glycosyltransferase involved in cell wall biosynthesis
MAKSICFISRYTHYVLSDRSDTKIGGAEFQQAIIAQALCDKGWRVSFISEKAGTRKPFWINGILIFPAIDYTSGNPYMRRIFRPLLELWRSMKKADADIYYQRNPGAFSAFIGIFCRIAGKQFVLAGANDANFDRENELNINSILDTMEIKAGIRLAHKIILQNRRQKMLLKKYYRRNGSVFYNVYDPPQGSNKSISLSNNFQNRKLLWVGRIAPQKRPELCVQLARLLAEYQIIMVGSRTHHHELSKTITRAVQNTPNIEYLGHLPLSEVEKLFDSSQGLVNTSFVEGFPNTFLQAWSRGLPVFSFVEPDYLITKHDLGAKVSSLDDMAAAISRKLSDKETFLKEAKGIKDFFKKNFAVAEKIIDLENILLA